MTFSGITVKFAKLSAEQKPKILKTIGNRKWSLLPYLAGRAQEIKQKY